MLEQLMADAKAAATQYPPPHWAAFGWEYVWCGPRISALCPTLEELLAFQKTEEYALLQTLLNALRASQESRNDTQVMITIRMPQQLRTALHNEAHSCRTSMNQLCITKLMQPLPPVV